MTETEKKELSEWMGWKFVDAGWGPGWFFDKPGGTSVLFSEWKPDTNPEQFLEVLDHMTEKEIEAVTEIIFNNTNVFSYEIQDCIWIMNHKSEVIKAILQTINQ